MKQIFKVVFFISLMLNFSFADTIKDDKATLQDQNLTKQVDELCEAIIADDYDKVKAMLDKNPELVNLSKNKILSPLHVATVNFTEKNKNILNLLLNNGANPNEYIEIENSGDFFQFSYPAQILQIQTNFKNKINLLKLFEKYGLDLNNSAIISDSDPVYLPAFIILYRDNYNDADFEIFDYFSKKRINPEKALSYIIFLNIGTKINEYFESRDFDKLYNYLKGDEYLKLRNKYKKYFISSFSNYKIDDFSFDEILDIIIFFVITKDEEILELLFKNGFINDEVKIGIKKFCNQENLDLGEYCE
ncbi:hypothetical protein [Campylobacter ureolyticus]|uniref:hypothetical protein n=1 Tax=Campylobacter ureolyticus TaxID=827 RepID=UPI0022B4F530|nr:hypothetical protein [Campylobacter ureolyticus]MCZ6168049.1 hypothetical protein [Campylobacter ureolyticus]